MIIILQLLLASGRRGRVAGAGEGVLRVAQQALCHVIVY